MLCFLRQPNLRTICDRTLPEIFYTQESIIMPGKDHKSWCTCPWCTGGRRGQPDFNLSSFSKPISTPKVSSTPQTDKARTYSIKCWWCPATVYYHTNGYGDSVLFDSIGCPWQVHDCWENHREEKKNVKLFELKVEKFKCLVLAGSIRKLQTERKIPTEKSVAAEMGISVEELSQHYKDFYVVVPKACGRIVLCQGF